MVRGVEDLLPWAQAELMQRVQQDRPLMRIGALNRFGPIALGARSTLMAPQVFDYAGPDHLLSMVTKEATSDELF